MSGPLEALIAEVLRVHRPDPGDINTCVCDEFWSNDPDRYANHIAAEVARRLESDGYRVLRPIAQERLAHYPDLEPADD